MHTGAPLLGWVSRLTCPLIRETVKITQSVVSRGMIFSWRPKLSPPTFWLLVGCPLCLCSWCSELLKIFCAYDRTKVISFKLRAPRADDQVKVVSPVLSAVCPSVSIPVRLGDQSPCIVAASWPICLMLWYLFSFFFFPYNIWNPSFVLRTIPEWNSLLNSLTLQIRVTKS